MSAPGAPHRAAAVEREQMFLDEVQLLAELMILANDCDGRPGRDEVDRALGLRVTCSSRSSHAASA